MLMNDVTASGNLAIQLLGEFKVDCSKSTSVLLRFRSKTAEALLISMALRLGRSISKAEISDQLWPDSDGDRQAQNFRRALSDVRQVIEDDSRNSLIVLSQGDRIWLDSERCETDVRQFKTLTDAGLEGQDCESNLRAAIQLYQGPLLPGHAEPWLEAHRLELEERFSQAVELLISLLLESSRHEEALRIGRHAVIAAPLREDVHITLMRAYASSGLTSQAIRQYEELESLLSSQWGEPPSELSQEAFRSLGKTPHSLSRYIAPGVSLSPRESTGGGMPARSPFYIARGCDRSLRDAIEHREGVILIQGARQVGKTSLLGRVLNEVDKNIVRVAVTDFQVLSKAQLGSAETLCRTLAYGFAMQLGVQIDFSEIWNEWVGPNSNLDAVVRTILETVNAPVIWAMDEADLLFSTDYADDFFGLIRGWFNRRAMDAEGPFTRLTVVISYATEAHLFIKDLNQSPFNVGLRIPVKDFDLSETRELSHRYGLDYREGVVQRLLEVTGGQPYLTRKAFDALAHDGVTLESIEKDAASDTGPFGDHLKRLLAVASRDAQTKSEVIRFLLNKPFSEPDVPLRLIAGGMLWRKPDGQLEFRVRSYREFLTKYLIGSE